MKSLLTILFLGLSVLAYSQKTIYGKVSDGNAALQKVRVLNMDSQTEVETDSEGSYRIEASKGEYLVYQLYGFKEVKIRIEDVTTVLNPIMVPKINELDEVEVSEKMTYSQQELQELYHTDKSIFMTAFGMKDYDAVSGTVQIIDGKELNLASVCILDIMSRFVRLAVSGNCAQQIGSVYLRRALLGSINNVRPVVWDIDGQLFTDTPFWLDLQNIDRISILAGMTMTNAYGSLASGGAIVINTKMLAMPYASPERYQQEPIGSDAISADLLDKDRPQYLIDIEKASTTEEALLVFENYKNQLGSSPFLYLDAANHFWKARGNRTLAIKVLEEGNSLWAKNPVLLKAKAFLLDAMGETKLALYDYQQIFELRPDYAQSFRDLAQAYARNGEARKAAAHYSRYGYVKEEKMLDHLSSAFDTLVVREQRQLLRKYGDQIIPDYHRAMELQSEDFAGTRLVMEWNDGEAEFDLEFVNPKNQTFVWRHSLMDNEELIKKEKDQGFSSKEFLLDGSLPGVWKMNVKYLGNKSLSPTYFKLTQYFNFGTAFQSEKITFYKVMTKGVNFELETLVDSGQLAGK